MAISHMQFISTREADRQIKHRSFKKSTFNRGFGTCACVRAFGFKDKGQRVTKCKHLFCHLCSFKVLLMVLVLGIFYSPHNGSIVIQQIQKKNLNQTK